MFIVNGVTVYVLFDLRATRYFVSLVHIKKFSDALGTLDCPLEVEIVDDHTVSTSRVHLSCILELFHKK